MSKTEEWRAIPGFELLYEASDFGRIRRINAWKAADEGRVLSANPNGSGYPALVLRDADGKRHRVTVHRLVAKTFLGVPPSPEHRHVAHINGNRADPIASNLRWSTPAENMEDMKRHGRSARGSRNRTAKLTEEDVLKIHSLSRTMTQAAIAERFGVHPVSICTILSGRTWGWLKPQQSTCTL
jgi:hypothetical protein